MDGTHPKAWTMENRNLRPKSGEAPFHLDEIFFSRTDKRGTIQAWNSVFERVADFPPERLQGAPHRIIRHENMPKGVFWLMWEALKAGQRFGGYVCNKACDGLFYWVYAIVTPTEDGYTSVRIEPTSPLLAKVTALYADALAAEREEGLTPEASGHRILQALEAEGFPTYAAFASASIAAEVVARDAGLGRPVDPRLAHFREMREIVQSIVAEQRSLLSQMYAMRLVPVNMRIMAARIERQGGAVSAISDNYRLLSSEVADQLSAFVEDGMPTSTFQFRAMERALFLSSAWRIMSEADAYFRGQDDTESSADLALEASRLRDVMNQTRADSDDALRTASARAIRRESQAISLGRAILSLDSIRIMCRVANERLRILEGGLAAVVASLDIFHTQMAKNLEEILALTHRLKDHAEVVQALRG